MLVRNGLFKKGLVLCRFFERLHLRSFARVKAALKDEEKKASQCVNESMLKQF